MNELSGQLVFLFFALPCKKFRLKQNPELSLDFEHLEKCAKEKRNPGLDLIKKCFPVAFEKYYECQSCQESGYQNDFSTASVENHWRYHHGHEGDCAIKTAMILSVTSDGANVICGRETFAVSNPYQIILEEFDYVLIHHKTIVVKDEKDF